MPAMIRIITDASGSRRSVSPTEKSPELIQVNARRSMTRLSGSRLTRRATAAAEIANESSIAPQAITPAAVFVTRRPSPAFSRKPANGRSGISSSMAARTERTRSLPFQARERVRVERLAVTEQPDHDREADGGLRGGDRHHEEHDDLAVGGAQRSPECDEGQVHGVQHDLDRQQDRDQVAAHEHTGRADAEQHPRQHEIVGQRRHAQALGGADGPPSRRASTTAPTMATRMSTEVTSNANA